RHLNRFTSPLRCGNRSGARRLLGTAAGRPTRGRRDPRDPGIGRRVRRHAWPGRFGGPHREGPRRAYGRPRGTGGRPAMSALRRPRGRPGPGVVEPVPRRGRPPQREGIVRSGRLAGIAAHDLAARFGTPAYLYDLDLVERRYLALRAALPPRVDVAYA